MCFVAGYIQLDGWCFFSIGFEREDAFFLCDFGTPKESDLARFEKVAGNQSKLFVSSVSDLEDIHCVVVVFLCDFDENIVVGVWVGIISRREVAYPTIKQDAVCVACRRNADCGVESAPHDKVCFAGLFVDCVCDGDGFAEPTFVAIFDEDFGRGVDVEEVCAFCGVAEGTRDASDEEKGFAVLDGCGGVSGAG